MTTASIVPIEPVFQAWWLCFIDGAVLTTYNAVLEHMKLTGHVDFKIHPKEINA